jgi:hypothetical protein
MVPAAVDAIGVQDRVYGNERQAVAQALGHKQAVEGVTVVERERRDTSGMAQFYWQQTNTTAGQLLREEVFHGLGQSDLSDADFDGDFPDTGDAEDFLIRGILDHYPCRWAKLHAAEYKPEECVRV